MSHFVVMVTRTDEESLKSQLEPFCEQGEDDDYYMEKEYYLLKDETEVSHWIEKEIDGCNKLLNDPEFNGDKDWWDKQLKKVKLIQQEPNLEKQIEMIGDLEGYRLDDKGLFYLINPNAKWDWWVKGGRWDGWLMKKDGKHCNRCKVKELDFDEMRINDMADRAKWYVYEVEKAKLEKRKPLFWGWEKKPTIKQYIESVNHFPVTYAVLHDGNWYSEGEMGWFGIDDKNYSDEEWEEGFKEFISKLDPETEVTIVDCHI